jgi:alternate signal-mediated exported protein
VAVTGLGGWTLASWHASAAAPLGVITAGDLNLSVQGQPFAWVEDGVTDPAHGDTAASLRQFVAMPGSQVTFTQGLTGDAVGANMATALTVDVIGSQPDGATLTFMAVDRASGTLLAPASGVAAPGEVMALPAGTDPDDVLLVGHITVAGDVTWTDPGTPTTSRLDLGDGLKVTLAQVREGANFKAGAP